MFSKNVLMVVVVILVLLGAVFVVNQKGKTETYTDQAQSNQVDTDKGETTTEKFKDFLAQKTPTQCTYEYDSPTGKMTGTVYFVGEEKMRADFTTTPETGQTVETSMIRDNTTMYVWSSLSTVGTQFSIDEVNQPVKSEDDPLEVLNRDDVKYSCSGWIQNQSFFTPPTNITFNDATQQLENLQENVNQNPAANCSLCDQTPEGESRSQCKQALGCP